MTSTGRVRTAAACSGVGSGNGLDQFDRQTGTVTLHIPVPDRLHVGLFEDRAGHFWITQETGSGLSLYDKSTNTLTRYSFYPHDPPSGGVTGVRGRSGGSGRKLVVGLARNRITAI